MVNKCHGRKDMNPGNLIIHLPLQARNLAVTLESDLSLSHPTSSPLPSSVESSPKYLLDATPPLHCHSLCPGSAPQPLALRNHHQRFRTTSPAAGCNMATWGMVLHRTAAIQVGSSPSLSFQRVISNPLRWHTKVFRTQLWTTFPATFPAVHSCPLCSLFMYVSHTPKRSLLLPALWAWASYPSACLSCSLLLQGSATPRTSCEPIRVELGVFLWAPVALLHMYGINGTVSFSSLCRELLSCCHSASFSFASTTGGHAWPTEVTQWTVAEWMHECKNEAMNIHSALPLSSCTSLTSIIRKDINHKLNCPFIPIYILSYVSDIYINVSLFSVHFLRAPQSLSS